MAESGEEEEEEEEEDGGLLDFESLEEEARDAVRDYSRSLARQLGIGVEICTLSFLCTSCYMF